MTGGVGYLCKAHGPSADNILEITIVTSDGQVRVCSKDVEPDLFFAARGAAPNVGIVTEVKIQAYRHPDVVSTLRAWPLSGAMLERLSDWSDQEAVLHDPNITSYFALVPSPDMKAHLAAAHIVCVGPPEEEDKYMQLIGQLDGMEHVDLVPAGRHPFNVPQTVFDAAFGSKYWYVTQAYFPGDKPLPAACLKEVAEAFSNIPLGPVSPNVVFEQRGSVETSAYHQAPSDSCSQPRFGQRWEAYVFFSCEEKKDAEAMREAGRAMKQVLLKHATAGGRSHLSKDDPSQADWFYGPNTKRLQEVVAKYDPHRLFAKCNGIDF